MTDTVSTPTTAAGARPPGANSAGACTWLPARSVAIQPTTYEPGVSVGLALPEAGLPEPTSPLQASVRARVAAVARSRNTRSARPPRVMRQTASRSVTGSSAVARKA